MNPWEFVLTFAYAAGSVLATLLLLLAASKLLDYYERRHPR